MTFHSILEIACLVYIYIMTFLSDPEGLARKKLKVEERIDLDRYFQGGILAGSVAQGSVKC